jgi:hypothetical protein
MNPLSWFKTAGLLGLVVAIGLGMFYISNTNSKLTSYAAENTSLKIQVAQYELAIKELQKNFELQKSVLTNLYTDMLAAGIPEDKIRDFFLNTNIDEIAVADPEKAQELINQQQDNIQRCFEILSGGAKNPGEGVNPICPNL